MNVRPTDESKFDTLFFHGGIPESEHKASTASQTRKQNIIIINK